MEQTEHLTHCYDRVSRMRAIIAVDDTTLGPSLGGVRWFPYPTERAAENEVRRLARVMTLKNACADLPYGGGKAVLIDDGTAHGPRRNEQLRAFGRFLERLGGTYIPGVDMGTSVEDMAVIGTATGEVSCDREDPSPWTALGVFAGIQAILTSTGTEMAGAHVVVQGTGHVGAELARRLTAAGCRVSIADVNSIRARGVAEELGAEVLDPHAVVASECDVFAPCATAKVIDHTNVGALRCRIVAGGANDVLASHDLAKSLERQGIVYVPDFVINAGGVIHIHAVRSEWDNDKLMGALLAIGDRVARIARDADVSHRTLLEVSESMASHRLGRPITLSI